jgi:hypothetical protein
MKHQVQNWAERIISILGFATVAIVPASCSLQARQPAPTASDLSTLGLQERSLRIGKIDRWFLVQPPADLLRPAPVLLVLHGGTQSMRRLFAPEAGATRGGRTPCFSCQTLPILTTAIRIAIIRAGTTCARAWRVSARLTMLDLCCRCSTGRTVPIAPIAPASM